jgi:Mor family transcriptional regulator
MKKMSLQVRNAEIVQKRNTGASYKVIASEFGLSRSRVQQIVRRAEMEEKRQEQSTKLLSEIRMVEDIDKNWPTESLINGLQFPWKAKQCLTNYFCCSEGCEISLRDIMDFLITDYEEIPNDLYEACPAHRQKHVGRKTYGALIKYLSEQDFGHAFGIEWKKRLRKLMCFMKKRWGYIPDSFRKYEI